MRVTHHVNASGPLVISCLAQTPSRLSTPAATLVILDTDATATTTSASNQPGSTTAPVTYREVTTACCRNPPVSPQAPVC